MIKWNRLVLSWICPSADYVGADSGCSETAKQKCCVPIKVHVVYPLLNFNGYIIEL